MSNNLHTNGKLDKDVIDVAAITDSSEAESINDNGGNEKKSIISLTPQQKQGKAGKLTNAERKEIVINQCDGFGISLTNKQIATIIKQSRADSVHSRNQFITFARGILQQAIADLEESTREDLMGMANEFIDDINDSNRRFEEDVNATFQAIGEQLKAGNKKSAEAFEAFKAELNAELNQPQGNSN